MSGVVWIAREVILAIHHMQLAEHGGPQGAGDAGLLDAVLTHPQHLAGHGTPDDAALTAARGWGIARRHPFIDGNERTACVATEPLLQLNGFELRTRDGDCVLTLLALAAGDLSEDAFADWPRRHVVQAG
ncbi:MAG TPA: Fic family protein [Ottowia sp.]|nr:Fic family protein [Ottowia sp.]